MTRTKYSQHTDDYRIMEIASYGDYRIEDIFYEQIIHKVRIKVKATAEYIFRHLLLDKDSVYLDCMILLLDHLFLKNRNGEYTKPDHITLLDEHLYNIQLSDYISIDLHRKVMDELNSKKNHIPIQCGFGFVP